MWNELLSNDKLIYEPPATKGLSYHELLSMIEPDPSEFCWDFLLHSQPIEWAVKLVSEVTKKAFTLQSRHGLTKKLYVKNKVFF